MWLVVGLGNPGPEYQGHRHNLGFLVVDELSRRSKAGPWRAKMGAELGEATLQGQRLILCKPMEFMNLSGQAVARVAAFWKIAVEQTVVVHDELDLPFGRLKLGSGGGAGGHNGVRSLLSCLGSPDFNRVRAGVSRPPAPVDPADWVLSNFSRSERAELPAFVDRTADAVVEIVTRGLTAACNKFNTRPKRKTAGDDA